MSTIRVTRDFGPIDAALTADDLREAGDLLIRRIRTRTEGGIDVHGSGFREYSPGYAKAKQAALGHTRVDLTVSGQMLNDMHVTEATPHGATVTFVSQGGAATGATFIQRSRSVGAADKAAFNNPTREFFGASEEDEQAIADGLERLLAARLGLQ